MGRDARVATIVRDATIQAEADQAKAANNDQAKAANNDQAKAVTLVAREQKQEGLKMWKELLIQTKDYRPFQQRTNEENLKEVKVLRSAMNNFRSLKLSGIDSLRATHPDFRFLQEKYHIPGDFCMPEELFREEQLDYSIIYYKRCCSVYDFYNMLSVDNPCFEDRQSRRANKESLAVQSETNKSVRQEPIKSLRHESPAA
jgi:hypothetical protein